MNLSDTEFMKLKPTELVNRVKLTNWQKEPTVSELKYDLQQAKHTQSIYLSKLDYWDKLYEAPKFGNSKHKGSRVNPKLVRKQAEWSIPSLTEPFLSTSNLFLPLRARALAPAHGGLAGQRPGGGGDGTEQTAEHLDRQAAKPAKGARPQLCLAHRARIDALPRPDQCTARGHDECQDAPPPPARHPGRAARHRPGAGGGTGPVKHPPISPDWMPDAPPERPHRPVTASVEMAAAREHRGRAGGVGLGWFPVRPRLGHAHPPGARLADLAATRGGLCRRLAVFALWQQCRGWRESAHR